MRCCLWGEDDGTPLPDVPTLCAAHRRGRVVDLAHDEARTVRARLEADAAESRAFYQSLVDAEEAARCRRAVDWRRSTDRSWFTSVETEDK